MNESVEIHLLTDEQYPFKGIFTKSDMISVETLPNLELDLKQIFI
ncbi:MULTISPECIES: hypothetical protein [Oceanobacillus]|uniref:Uncharacterized protein n=1 Tax=Oceanobacillus aidingensis TaxID=645964 RepID=A0ABV9JW14_9BACI|nr:hypothetical protein [Oceanobacillus oncorhynchi]MDM8102698.1 hypothetical protein [Oceanobacillus oncorhynchi]